MFFSLFIASLLMTMGCMAFGAFEIRTPLPIRFAKFAVLLIVTALLHQAFGQFWALLWIGAMFGVGLGFHTWWTRRNGIGFWRPEPADRYYALRGWSK